MALLTLAPPAVFLGSAAGAPLSPLKEFDAHIHHIIFLMQENNAYDDLFGVYCLQKGKLCPDVGNGLPPNTCLPEIPYANPAAPTCLRPWNFTKANLTIPDMAHDWYSTHLAWSNGKMDGFWPAEGDVQNTMGHYNGSTVPVLWDLAEQYGLADNFFTAAKSYSLSNHWYLVAAQAPVISYTAFPPWAPTSVQHTYLNESNVTPTIADQLLNGTRVSWKYYDFGLQPYQSAITPSLGGTAYDLWNPLAARNESYRPGLPYHFVDRSTFFSDAAAGTLPDVSWIIPAGGASDHPGTNYTYGENWTASVVNALEGSPEWNSSVLFESWDEYGGYYDHVAPPNPDVYGDGFRAPLLAIGPWVRQGVIDHQRMDFSSILRLMELRFGLKCLGPRDCGVRFVPLEMFDFNGTARAPIAIPYWGSARYPMALQSSGRLPPFDRATIPPPFTGDDLPVEAIDD